MVRNVRGYPSSYCSATTRAYCWHKCLYFIRTTTHLTFRNRNSATKRDLAGAVMKRSEPPAESGGASKVRHVNEKARREVDLSSSYLKNGSKPGLNRTLRLLSCNLRLILHAFIPQRSVCKCVVMPTMGIFRCQTPRHRKRG